MDQLTPEQRQLRARISTATDKAVSANFTEDQVQSRVAEWQLALDHHASQAETATFLLNEFRGLMEDTLFNLLDQ